MEKVEELKKYNNKILENYYNPNGYYSKEAFIESYNGIYMKAYNFMYNHNKDFLNDTAMTYFGENISFGKMFETYDDLTNDELYAKALKKYGISKGDYVSICLPNIPEVVYFKYALNRIGAIANMMDPRTNPERILSYVNNTNSKLLISILS